MKIKEKSLIGDFKPVKAHYLGHPIVWPTSTGWRRFLCRMSSHYWVKPWEDATPSDWRCYACGTYYRSESDEQSNSR